MKTLLVMLAAVSTGTQAVPTVAQFNSAMAAACPQPRAVTRNVTCHRADAGSMQFTCTYQLQGANGRWASQTATLTLAEGEWVWIDGATRCGDEDQPDLN